MRRQIGWYCPSNSMFTNMDMKEAAPETYKKYDVPIFHDFEKRNNMKPCRYVALDKDGLSYEVRPHTEIVLSPNGKVWLLSNVPGTWAVAREDVTEKVKLQFYDAPDEVQIQVQIQLLKNQRHLLQQKMSSQDLPELMTPTLELVSQTDELLERIG